MANWAGGVLTAAGRRLQAKVEAGATLALTKIKLGSGMETIADVDGLDELMIPEFEIPISTATVSGEVCTVTGVLHCAMLPHGFYCREWGIFAEDPDEGEILYMVTIDDQPDWLPSTADTDISVTYSMNIAVASATQITANIDLAGLVDVEMLENAVHAVKRRKRYEVGQLATASTLPSGLLLQCAAGGTTADTLIDWTQYELGGVVVDGEVTWHVVRWQVTDGSALTWRQMEERENWLYRAVITLRDIVRGLVQSVQSVGLPAVLSSSQPESASVAWLKAEGDVAPRTLSGVRHIFEDGGVLDGPLVKLAMEDGSEVYIDTSGGASGVLEALDNLSATDFAPVTGNTATATNEDVDRLFS